VFYAHALAGDGIKVNVLAPGLRRTDLNATAAASDGDPAEAAAGAVRLALLPDDGPSGEFFSWDGTPLLGNRPHLTILRHVFSDLPVDHHQRADRRRCARSNTSHDHSL
jgi:NAD(P)-dependent dehydrogenase (short-subunit alcohol dehydrogenase family)